MKRESRRQNKGKENYVKNEEARDHREIKDKLENYQS